LFLKTVFGFSILKAAARPIPRSPTNNGAVSARMPVQPGAVDRSVNGGACARFPTLDAYVVVPKPEPGFRSSVLPDRQCRRDSFKGTDMIHKLACAAAVAIAMTSIPAFAKPKAAGCTDDSIARADAAVMKMPDGDTRTAAMQEMTSAKSSMSQKDMAGCSMHVSKAMKMTAGKGRKG
jgi:hypothetical protein